MNAIKNSLIIISAVFSVGIANAQPVQWNGNGHWYQAVGTCSNVAGVTWADAKAYAEEYGTHLATISSADENDFVHSLVTDVKYWVWPEPTSSNNIGPWLGGYQASGAVEPSGSWYWAVGNDKEYFMDPSGSPIPDIYTNWCGGEPNNAFGDENALAFLGIGPGFNPGQCWNDFADVGRTLAGEYYVPKGFVVEKDDGSFDTLPDWCNAISVVIDIKPGSFPNSINPRNKGVIPVAILTTTVNDNKPPFDATTVDPSTVRFGKNGTEASPQHSAIEDVNKDGYPDMILQFNTQEAGIGCGDTSAKLTGKTISGEDIRGTDSIRTTGCK